jgi:hypothetical protein
MNQFRISQLFVYPIKSAKGIALDSMQLDQRGPLFDRHWMVIKENGMFQTQRQLPKMCMIETALDNGELTLSAPGMPELRVEPNHGGTAREVEIWKDRVEAQDCGDKVANWLSEYLGRSLRLVEMPRSSRRLVDPEFAFQSETVGFADGFPLLLVSQASLDDFNRHLSVPIGMDRFRPNIVIEGCSPFAEDGWQAVQVGELSIRLAKPCSRCIIPSIDQQSGEKQKPVNQALLDHRRRDGKTFFGQNGLHSEAGTISVGDQVSVVQNN